jgi:hypothetical protein
MIQYQCYETRHGRNKTRTDKVLASMGDALNDIKECKQCHYISDVLNYVNGYCVQCQLTELLGVNDRLLGECNGSTSGTKEQSDQSRDANKSP